MADADPARAKFFFLAAHRVIGAALVMLGMLVLAGRLPWGTPVGAVLLGFGLLDFFVVPLALARVWRTPPE